MNSDTRLKGVLLALSLALVLTACSDSTEDSAQVETNPDTAVSAAPGAPEIAEPAASENTELAGTAWELLEIQSMDDSSWAPDDPSRYTLVFGEDGQARMQLDCNRGMGSWRSEGPGQLTFGPVAGTRALCQDDGLSERYAAQFEWVRTYVLEDGHLFLATMADGAIIEFQPAE